MISGKLVADLTPRARLRPADIGAMWALFQRYYEDVDAERFQRDLAEKQYVFVLRDSGDGSVQGFSTVQVYDDVIDGRRVRTVYSGDTVVERAYWGQNALQRAFFLFLVREKLSRPHVPLFWFLISKGYKTYLLVTRNFPHHYPRHDASDRDGGYASIVSALARRKFGESFDVATGTLRFAQCLGRLRAQVAPVSEREIADPAIAYFIERNPGHESGDELCCLAEVDFSLVTFYTQKLLARTLAALFGRRPAPSLIKASAK